MNITSSDMPILTEDQSLELITAPVEEQKPEPLDLSNMDPRELIKKIAEFNPKMANKLFYKHMNQPRQTKTLDKTDYMVMPNGSWRRMTPKNNKSRQEIDPRSLDSNLNIVN
jgi:hypothetical protein